MAVPLNQLSIVLLQERIQRLAKCVYDEANLAKCSMVQDVAAIKNESGLVHLGVHRLIIIGLELIPLGQNADRVSIRNSVERSVGNLNQQDCRYQGQLLHTNFNFKGK